MTTYLLNTPILTSFGVFEHTPSSTVEAKAAVVEDNKLKPEVVSAIGHEATARYFSALLGVEVPVNRISINMRSGDVAFILRCTTRLPEGKILSHEEMNEFEWQITKLTAR